jgi:hypothetical protein
MAGFLIKLAAKKAMQKFGEKKLSEKGMGGSKGGDSGGGDISAGKSSASKGLDYGSSSAAGGAGELKRQPKRSNKYSD